jgi:hypothetical protein
VNSGPLTRVEGGAQVVAIAGADGWHAVCSGLGVIRVQGPWRRVAGRATVARMSARVLLVLVTLAGCDAGEDAEAELVARDTLAALGGSSAQLRLYDGLLGLVDLKGISLALAPQQAIAQVEAGLADDLEDPNCLELDTDEATFLALEFTKCRYRGVFVDGALRIDLTTETGTCDGADCVVATRYTTRLTALRIGRTVVHTASSSLRIPTVKAEARTYTAEAALTDPERGDLELRHEVSWVRRLGCVAAELGAEFVADDRTISVGATGVEVCGDACPRAGEVHIAWASGEALAWEFDGSGEIEVHGPRGRVFTVDQTCGADP